MNTIEPCKGMNCGTTTFEHSAECQAEHAAAVAGGYFVKSEQAATEAAKATSVTPTIIMRGEGAIDERIKTLMAQIGMPNSSSLYAAMKQLQNEIEQGVELDWPAEAARQPAPVVTGCGLCGSAIGHDLSCQNHPVNAKAPFQQDDEHKAFMATYLDIARKASDNTSAEMILWHANRHWNGKAGEMWRARAALAATAAPVLSDALEAMERAKLLPIWDNDVPHKLHVELDIIFKALATTRSQP